MDVSVRLISSRDRLPAPAPRWKGQCVQLAIAVENPFPLLSARSHLADTDNDSVQSSRLDSTRDEESRGRCMRLFGRRAAERDEPNVLKTHLLGTKERQPEIDARQLP